ncbi:MAG TPA: low molecular weight phosphatase family protein [Ruminococcaceae bacterium]|nr:low molecular weight phosphatase family protein [Oscillospiraceae bacterium]
MKKVLFVCTGNTCRSPMAQMLFNQAAKEKGLENEVTADSAGLAAFGGGKISRGALEALLEMGIDASDYRAKGVSHEIISEADLIVAMTYEHRRVFESMDESESVLDKLYTPNGGISDPYGGDITVYRATRDEISKMLPAVFERLGYTAP